MGPTSQPLRLGGMALGNGLLVHGPTHWAAAVRDKQGQIHVVSGKKTRVTMFDNMPGLRGVARLAEAMAVVPAVRRALPQARLPFENPRVLGSAAGVSMLSALLRKRGKNRALTEVFASTAGLIPAIMSLRQGDVASYHGVEHKSIAAYEQGGGNAADASKEHERCGSHLVAPMIAATLGGELLLDRLSKKPGPLARTGVAVAGVGAAVELFAWCERNPSSKLTKAVRAPGFKIQEAVGTREPTAKQLEVGEAAMSEILRVEQPQPA